MSAEKNESTTMQREGSDRIEPVHEEDIRIHAKTYIVVLAANLLNLSTLMCLTGSGLMAQYISAYLDNGSTSKGPWFSGIIGIFTLSLCPPVSQAADYWGRKWFIIITCLIGMVGCIVVSRSENINTVLAGFCLIGTATGSQSLVVAITAEVLPRRWRALGQGFFTGSSCVGAVIGVLMGGKLIVEHGPTGFRTYFYITAGVWLLSAVGVGIAYFPPPREEQVTFTFWQKMKQLDWVGYMLITSGLVLFSVGLEFSQNPYSWSNGHVSATFAVGVALLISFGLYEWKGRSDGLLHHDLFGDRNFSLGLFAVFLEGLCFFTSNDYLAFEAAVLDDLNLFQAAGRFAVLLGSTVILVMPAGAVITWTKQVRESGVIGFLCFTAYAVAMSQAKPGGSSALFWGAPILAGAGLALVLPTTTTAAQMATPPHMVSVTSGLYIAMRSFGGSAAVAVNNAVFISSLQKALKTKVPAAVLPLGFNPEYLGELIGDFVDSKTSALAQIPGITGQMIEAAGEAVLDSYSMSFRKAWIMSACLSGLGVLVCLCLRNSPGEFTTHVDAPVERSLLEAQEREKVKQDDTTHIEYAGQV